VTIIIFYPTQYEKVLFLRNDEKVFDHIAGDYGLCFVGNGAD
jgi:hypothetical protein